MTERPLPTVVGPTENALRALLLRTLEPTPISSYEEWAYLNMRSAGAPKEAIASALRVTPQDLSVVVDELVGRDLLDAPESITATGAEALRSAREVVTAMTRTLTEGIDEEDAAIARRVLDTLRVKAEALLAG